MDSSKDASSCDPAAGIMLTANKLSIDAKKITDDTSDPATVFDGTKDVARDALLLVNSVKKAAEKELGKVSLN